MNYSEIQPGMKVKAPHVNSLTDETTLVEVGTVDHMAGPQHVQLKRSDSPDGQHHWFPVDWIARIDDQVVYVTKNADEFRAELLDIAPDVEMKKAV